ncbi:YraN family protein [Nesterenkonia suensis]
MDTTPPPSTPQPPPQRPPQPPQKPSPGPSAAPLTKDQLGLLGEQQAEAHLVAQGHIVLERRWRSRHGELDLITLDDAVLVGVEVKTRRGRGYGHPFESVTEEKLVRLHRLLREYAAQHRGVRVPLRIDAVSVLYPTVRTRPRPSRSANAPGERSDHLGAPQLEHLVDVRP